MSADEARGFGVPETERHFFIRMDKGKVNTVPPARVAKWFKLVGVALNNPDEFRPHGDEVQTVEPWTPPETWDFGLDIQNTILDVIDAGLPDGNRYSEAAKGERAAWKVVVKYVPDKNEAQAREVIMTWIRVGVLESREYINPVRGQKQKGLYVVARPK
jgi:hypothetical protein